MKGSLTEELTSKVLESSMSTFMIDDETAVGVFYGRGANSVWPILQGPEANTVSMPTTTLEACPGR